MILSFKDKRTREFAEGNRVRGLEGIERKAENKLDQLEAAMSLLDLDLPGNRLETLKGNRKGQHMIHINDQRRICFDTKLPSFI